MELIHIANATFSSLSFKTKHSLENLASKQKLSGLLKSRRCAHRHRRNHASIRAITPAHVGTLRQSAASGAHRCGSHGLASSRVVRRWAGSWWSQPGSNRRPPGCKPGALPAELWPLVHGPKSPAGKRRGSCPLRTTSLVGLGGVAPPTSPLSGVRSN